MLTFLKLYAIALVSFLAIDLVWLAVIARSFYQNQIGHLLRQTPNWAAAFAFYFLFVVGIVYFVVQPALAKNSLQNALLSGALFGLVTYAAYDLTNLAVTKDWPLTITLIDLVWGAVLCCTVSGITFAVARIL